MSSPEEQMEAPRAKPEHNARPAIPDPHKVAIAGAIVLATACGGFAAWGVLAPLSGAVIANGMITVDSNRKVVQHLEGGIVKEIRVRDGDRVAEGQTLIVLQDASVSASVDVLKMQLYGELAKAARVKAERDDRSSIEFPSELTARSTSPKVAEILHSEMHLFEVRRKSLDEQIRSLHGQIEEARKEVAGVTDQIESEMRAVDFLKEELAANEGLYNDKFISKARILTLKRELAQTEALRSEHVADVAKAKQKISELELRVLNLRVNRVQTAADDLETTTRKIVDLQDRIRPSQDAMQRQNVVAPVAGEVVNLKVHTIGGTLGPREPLLDIVPANNLLIVEARVGIDDIDEVHADMPADIRLTPYSQRSTPLFRGTVTYVSADRLTDEATHTPYYLAHVTVDPESLKSAQHVHLHPGMPAEVFIRTRDRTALEYLLEPMTNTLRRAARES
jgi:membrane fusion protein, epimerase transport system